MLPRPGEPTRHPRWQWREVCELQQNLERNGSKHTELNSLPGMSALSWIAQVATVHVKEDFYDALDKLITATPAKDKLVILGDFNARIGKDAESWPAIDRNGA